MTTMDDLKASAEALAMDVDDVETGIDSELGSAYEIGKETKVTPDGGILKTISKLGTGFDNPETGDSVTVHYVGTLEDGTKFDSSRDRHEPFTFTLGKGQVIKGWDQGVATMRKGEVSSLKIRSDYGYGEAGSPPKIPSNATLIFEIELISWKSVKDIAGDGGVIKTIVREGIGWAKPQDMDEVLVKFSARVQGSETPFYASSENGEEFSLEQGHFCKALSIAAKTMLKEETAKLVVAPEYGFGSEGRAPDVPSNAVLEIDLFLLGWKKVEKITEDGGVTKKILVESSEWKTPNADAKVKVIYKACLEDGTIFDSRTAENPLEFTTEEGEVIDGLDQAVMKMKQGEKALVTIAPQYAFGDQECTQYQATIPANSTVIYELTLKEFEKMKDSWEMTSEEKVAAASELKEKGNRHFKAGILLRALKKWERAHEMLRTDTDLDAEHRTAAKDVKKSCNLNLAAAHLKLGDCKKAIESATKVLECDCGNLKALYRRAQAYMTNGDFVEAEMDIRQGLMLDEASADFKVLLKKFKVAQAKAGRKEAALYSSMFKGLAREAKKAGKQPQTEVEGKENADMHEGNTSISNAAASQEGIVSSV